eukprot:g10669.t1
MKERSGYTSNWKERLLLGDDSDEDEAQAGDAGPTTSSGSTSATLRVNRTFAEKFQKRKDAEELAYARRVLEEEGAKDSDESSSESEDEDGHLLGDVVGCKVLDTLQRIRNKDKSIYDGKTSFFSSADFFEERRKKKEELQLRGDSGGSAQRNESKDGGASAADHVVGGRGGEATEKKPVLYKDLLRETLMEGGAEAFERDEERIRDTFRNMDKQANETDLADIRAQIKAEEGERTGDESDGEDLFKPVDAQKKKSREAELEDGAQGQDHTEAATGDNKRSFNLKKKKSAQQLLANKYWGENEEQLTENEKFLRDYILNEGWKDPTGTAFGGSAQQHGGKPLGDDSDEEDLADQDEFEAEYNFRHEHGGLGENGEIATFSRHVPNSVRQVDDKRRRKRLERKERKEQESIRRSEELKRLKNLKRKELQRRLRQIEKTTGNEGALVDTADVIDDVEDLTTDARSSSTKTGDRERTFARLLEKDFDPATYDAEMEAMLGGDFDEQQEALDEKELKQLTREGEVEEDWGDVVEEDWEDASWGDREAWDEENPTQGEQHAQEDEMWFLCDECKEPIGAGKNFYESPQKPDFTLCQKCFRNPAKGKKRKEKYTRKKVPEHCAPPANWGGAAGDEQAGPPQDCVLGPATGGSSLVGDPDEVEDDHEHELAQEQLSLDELFSRVKIRDFGPLKFQYSQVKADSFNLSTEDILQKSDKELNRKATLRKITRPYWDTSTYTDERTARYVEVRKEMKQQKRKKQQKSGIERSRLDAYKVKNPVLVNKNKK